MSALLGSLLLSAVREGHADPAIVLGLYAVPAEACSLVAASGFTIVQNYQFESWTQDQDSFLIAARSYMDEAQRHGLRVLLGVPRSWLAQRAEGRVRAVVRGAKEHPALLAWYEDERAQEGDLGAVQLLARVVQEEDPVHGLIIEEGRDLRPLRRIGRVRMFTYYPVTAKARQKGELRTLRERFPVANLTVPFWPVLQACGRDLIADCPQKDLMAPQEDELLFTLYSALQSGAAGVFVYTYLHSTRYDATRKGTGQWPYVDARPLSEVSPKLWRAALRVGQEARVVLPLLQRAQPARTVRLESRTRGLELREWHTARGTLLAIANSRARPAKIVLHLPKAEMALRQLRGGEFEPPRRHPGTKVTLTIPGPGGACYLLAD